MISGGCPGIIEQSLFDRVQERILKNKIAAGRYKSKTNYLLRGLIGCGACGKAMHGNTRKSGKKIIVFILYIGVVKACILEELNKHFLNMYVLTELKKIFLNRSKYRQLITNVNRYI